MFPSNEVVWFDDALPAGAAVGAASGTTQAWTADTTQHASGTSSFVLNDAVAHHQSYFSGGAESLSVESTDLLTAYVLLDPCNPPRQVMMQWYDGIGWTHRAYWGTPFGALALRLEAMFP